MFLKSTLTTFALTAALSTGCSNGTNEKPAERNEKLGGLGAFNQEVELTVRNRAGEPDNYVTSTFSFYHLTRDNVELTRNGWDIQASPGSTGEDEFDTEMVSGDVGLIADLGEISCQKIPNRSEHQGEYQGVGKGGYPHAKHRQTDPEFWFQYSDANHAIHDARDSKVRIQKGHCYVVLKFSSNTKVIAVFGVKEHKVGESVILHEIEVFEKARVY